MTKDKRRYSTNIDKDQIDQIEKLSETRRSSFAGMVRVLIDEALSHRRNLKLVPSEVPMMFEAWGKEGVIKLMFCCLEFLSATESTGEADQFLKDLAEGRYPSDESLVLLGDTLDIPVEKLMIVRKCFLEEAQNARH